MVFEPVWSQKWIFNCLKSWVDTQRIQPAKVCLHPTCHMLQKAASCPPVPPRDPRGYAGWIWNVSKWTRRMSSLWRRNMWIMWIVGCPVGILGWMVRIIGWLITYLVNDCPVFPRWDMLQKKTNMTNGKTASFEYFFSENGGFSNKVMLVNSGV